MRQPAINPAAALWSLIAALPDDRLREFVLEMLLVSLTAKAPITHADGGVNALMLRRSQRQRPPPGARAAGHPADHAARASRRWPPKPPTRSLPSNASVTPR